MMEFSWRFIWPQSPCSQLLFQSIFLRTSDANLSFCSKATHPKKVSIFKPLKFQRGKPWIHCDSSPQCLCGFLTSVKVCFSSVALSSCSLPVCDVSFQRLGGLKGFDWAMGHLLGWFLFVFWFEASASFPFLRLDCTPNLSWLCLCSPSLLLRLGLRFYVSRSSTCRNFKTFSPPWFCLRGPKLWCQQRKLSL